MWLCDVTQTWMGRNRLLDPACPWIPGHAITWTQLLQHHWILTCKEALHGQEGSGHTPVNTVHQGRNPPLRGELVRPRENRACR